ncbi:MAG: serine/threonine protein kinase [Leptolyngbya sp. BL-A-14]
MEQLVGQVLHDRYQIKSLLGRKTGRRTFLAHNLETRSPVVVKLMLFGPDFIWDDLKLFEREAETLKALNHPAIPTYLDFFEVDSELGQGFALVQSYIEARSLQEWVQSGRTFSQNEIKEISKALLEILDYLHSRQPPVVHRDLKPSNILLAGRSGNSPGTIYLIDFGSVQTLSHDGTITVVGTYGYMPPEQFGGRTLSVSDLYSLGATLIYLVTGQHPADLFHQDGHIEFAQITRLSPNFIAWLQWLTDPKASKRPKSARDAMQHFLQPPQLRTQMQLATQPMPETNVPRKHHKYNSPRGTAAIGWVASVVLAVFVISSLLPVMGVWIGLPVLILALIIHFFPLFPPED